MSAKPATLIKKSIGLTKSNDPVESELIDENGNFNFPEMDGCYISVGSSDITYHFNFGGKEKAISLGIYTDKYDALLSLYDASLGKVKGALIDFGLNPNNADYGITIYGNYLELIQGDKENGESWFSLNVDELAIYYLYGQNYEYGFCCSQGNFDFTSEQGSPWSFTFDNGLKLNVNPRQPAITYEGTISEEPGGSTGIGSYTLKYTPTYDEDGNLVGGCGTLAVSFTTAPSSGATLYLSNANTLPDLTGVLFGAGTPVMVAIEGAPSNGSILRSSSAFGASSYEGGINVYSN